MDVHSDHASIFDKLKPVLANFMRSPSAEGECWSREARRERERKRRDKFMFISACRAIHKILKKWECTVSSTTKTIYALLKYIHASKDQYIFIRCVAITAQTWYAAWPSTCLYCFWAQHFLVLLLLLMKYLCSWEYRLYLLVYTYIH